MSSSAMIWPRGSAEHGDPGSHEEDRGGLGAKRRTRPCSVRTVGMSRRPAHPIAREGEWRRPAHSAPERRRCVRGLPSIFAGAYGLHRAQTSHERPRFVVGGANKGEQVGHVEREAKPAGRWIDIVKDRDSVLGKWSFQNVLDAKHGHGLL